MKLNNHRIFIMGPSGTGKSTLANYISETYHIPYITTSSKPLWDKYGIKTHREIIERSIKDPFWGVRFQCELLDTRINLIQSHKRFVTDRSHIDNLVYFLLQNTPFLSMQDTLSYVRAVGDVFKLMENDFYIHTGFSDSIILEDDGKRIFNPDYQKTTQAVYDLVMHDYFEEELRGKCQEIMSWDWDTKISLAHNILKPLCKITPKNHMGL